MKRHQIPLGAAVVILSLLMTGCAGDLLLPDETDTNPYLDDARILVDELVDHTIEYANAYNGTHGDPGLILLEAMNAYAPDVIDLDVEDTGRRLAQAWSNPARKGPIQVPGLTDTHNAHLTRVFEAARVETPQAMRAAFAPLLRDARRALGEEGARPVLEAAAMLQAQFEFFTDKKNEYALKQLATSLRFAAGPQASASPRFLRIQDSTGTDPQPEAPPEFTEHFDPGDWWSNTINDGVTAGQGGVLVGASVGCGIGLLIGGPPACAGGAAIGGTLGGGIGVGVGTFVSGVAHFMQDVFDHAQDMDDWCKRQKDLPFAQRHDQYELRCSD
ncbi:MAG: hypothetical protein JJ896_02800 [Rhodothermales bacterium]|nr:hypothetical protein [Rhodothermales bacterium]MBO6778560.1 hypothetical protein [Rhodothermales bacterium]